MALWSLSSIGEPIGDASTMGRCPEWPDTIVRRVLLWSAPVCSLDALCRRATIEVPLDDGGERRHQFQASYSKRLNSSALSPASQTIPAIVNAFTGFCLLYT